MSLFSNRLAEYILIFGEKNRDGIRQIEIGEQISRQVAIIRHWIINELADMIYNKRRHIALSINQETDWLMAERYFLNKYHRDGQILVTVKSALLKGYNQRLNGRFNLPSFETVLTEGFVNDEKFIKIILSLKLDQWDELLDEIANITFDRESTGFYLRNEIWELYVDNEKEVCEWLTQHER